MAPFLAFLKKEFTEQARTGKLALLMIISCLFGIMNPAVAKLTPWLMEQMSSQLAQTGIQFQEIHIDALTSWAQFFKNMPLVLLTFLLLFSNTLTAEFQKGTLVHMVTKGLARWKILAAKACMMATLWTAGYWASFAITYAYNAYFWDNRVAAHLLFAACCFYLSGLWLISIILPASVYLRSGTAVLLAAGAAYLGAYILSLFAGLTYYSPVHLMDAGGLLAGAGVPADFGAAAVCAIVLASTHMAMAISIPHISPYSAHTKSGSNSSPTTAHTFVKEEIYEANRKR